MLNITDKKIEARIERIKTKLIKQGLKPMQAEVLSKEMVELFVIKAAADLAISRLGHIAHTEKLSPNEISLFCKVCGPEINESYIAVIKNHEITPELIAEITKINVAKFINNPADLATLLKAAAEPASWDKIVKVFNTCALKHYNGKEELGKLLEVISSKQFSIEQIKILNSHTMINTYVSKHGIIPVLEVVSKHHITYSQFELFNNDHIKYGEDLLADKSLEKLDSILGIISKHHLTKEQIETVHKNIYNIDTPAQLETALHNMEKYGYMEKPYFAGLWECFGYYPDPQFVLVSEKLVDEFKGD